MKLVRTAMNCLLVLVMICVQSLFVSACKRSSDTLVSTKVLALNPQEYLSQDVTLKGKLTKPSPALVSFILEDEAGRILTTTEDLGGKVECPENSAIVVLGRLRDADIPQRRRFSVKRFVECNPPPTSTGSK